MSRFLLSIAASGVGAIGLAFVEGRKATGWNARRRDPIHRWRAKVRNPPRMCAPRPNVSDIWRGDRRPNPATRRRRSPRRNHRRRRFDGTGAAGRRSGEAGPRTRRLDQSTGCGRRLRRRRPDDLAGVPPAVAGQPVLSHRVPRRDAAAGVPGLSVGVGSSRSGRSAGRTRLGTCRDHPGGLPLPRAAAAIGPGAAATTPSWTGRACSSRSTSRWARCCSSSSSRRAGGPPAGHCPSCAGCSSRTATTAGCCRRAGRSRMPGWTSIRSSTRCTTRAAASSALRSTWRRPTSCCSPSTARCSNSPAARRFFVDLSVAAFRRSRSAAGRTAVASGFLLGTVSGSGTATAVSVGAVTWPIMRRAGYTPERAGGMLAAAGVGALLSPPTLGAAAFIVAEYLEVSYLTVLGWATIPTVLYYLGILLAVEIDARRFGMRPANLDAGSPWKLLVRFGYHFSSLIAIVVLLAVGMSATRAVVYATALAFAAVVPGPPWPADAATAVRRAQRRRSRGAAGRRRLRRRRRHHRDDHQDRSRRAVLVGAGRRGRRDHRQPHADAGADRGLRRGRAGDARPGDTGHRVVRHRLGDHRPGAA